MDIGRGSLPKVVEGSGRGYDERSQVWANHQTDGEAMRQEQRMARVNNDK